MKLLLKARLRPERAWPEQPGGGFPANPRDLRGGRVMKKRMALAVLFAVIFCAPVMGEDLNIPWWRGQISTTSQMWEFSTDQSTNLLPDGPAPGGQPPLPSTMVKLIEPGPLAPWDHWYAQYGLDGRLGVWPLSGLMDVIVDNHNPPNEVKMVWVQLTWMSQDGLGTPIFQNLNPAPVQPPQLLQQIVLPDGWFHSTYYWEIRPNPPDEMFTITGTINVDELVIDTWCIPEPGTVTLAVLGLGTMLVLRRRRS